MATPLDIRLGLTKPQDRQKRSVTAWCGDFIRQDVAYKLRWGILGCGPISSDWCKCLKDLPRWTSRVDVELAQEIHGGTR